MPACPLPRSHAAGSDVPRPISRLWPLGVIQVACGGNHSAALLVDGRLLTWGHGRHGQLGHGDMENRSTPAVVRALLGVRGQQVSCGDDHTALLAADGSLWTFGRCAGAAGGFLLVGRVKGIWCPKHGSFCALPLQEHLGADGPRPQWQHVPPAARGGARGAPRGAGGGRRAAHPGSLQRQPPVCFRWVRCRR